MNIQNIGDGTCKPWKHSNPSQIQKRTNRIVKDDEMLEDVAVSWPMCYSISTWIYWTIYVINDFFWIFRWFGLKQRV